MKRFSQYRTFTRGLRTVALAALVCLVFATVSCRTIKTVEVPVYVHDTTEVTKYVHDSTFIENTIKEYIKGDTCFVERWHTKYKEKTVHDTTFVYREVPIEVPTTEYVEVERELTWWQRALMCLGACFVISVLWLVAILLLGLKKK